MTEQETSIAIDATSLFEGENGIYRRWNGRLWQKTNRPAPGVLGHVDREPITKDRMRLSGERMGEAIGEFDARRRKGLTSRPSLLADADDKGVRHAFTSLFSDTQNSDLKGRFVQAAVEEEDEIVLEQARGVARVLADQTLLIDGEAWVASIGPVLSPDLNERSRGRLQPSYAHVDIVPGIALQVHDADSLETLLDGIKTVPKLSPIMHDHIRGIRFDGHDNRELVDAFNATGAGWSTLFMLHRTDLDELSLDEAEAYERLRDILEAHAALERLPLREDHDFPYEGSHDSFPAADEIWSLVQRLQSPALRSARPTGSSSRKLEFRTILELATASERFAMAELKGIAL